MSSTGKGLNFAVSGKIWGLIYTPISGVYLLTSRTLLELSFIELLLVKLEADLLSSLSIEENCRLGSMLIYLKGFKFSSLPSQLD